MKVLVIGQGGREHALVWKLAQSASVDEVFCAPGNAGTAEDGTNLDISATDAPRLVKFAKDNQIGLTVNLAAKSAARHSTTAQFAARIANRWVLKSLSVSVIL